MDGKVEKRVYKNGEIIEGGSDTVAIFRAAGI
jgi:hypothetical protein